MDDQSLVLAKIADDQTEKDIENSQVSVSALTEHQLLESQNSMVNMAITMDQFTIQNNLKKHKAKDLEYQKKNLEVYTAADKKPGQEEQPGDLSANKYSADEFESDDSKEPKNDEEEKEEVRQH